MESGNEELTKSSSIRRVSLLFTQSCISRVSLDVSKEIEPDKKKKKYNRNQWITLATLAFGNFCVGACVSLQAPFFPHEAEKKGATATEYGFIFGVYELTVFASAPIMGKLVSLTQPKFLMNSGMFGVGVTCICFGVLDYVQTHAAFVGLAFAVRIMEGIAAAALQTSCFVLIADAFPDKMATTFALLETFIGLGLITGPTLGGALFDAGGYGLPFYVMGTLMVINSIIVLVALPNPEREENPKEGNWAKFWLHPVTMIYVIIIFSSFNYIGFNSATLEPHLRPFKLTGVYLGLIFALAGTLYAVTAPFWGYLCDKKFDPKVICIFGCMITIVSLLLIGPMPFLNLKSGVWITVGALALKGTAVGAKLVCGFAGSLSDTVARGFPSDLSTYGLVSSMFASSQSLGAFVGPSLGGFLLDTVGYDYGVTVVLGFECLVLLFLIVYTITSRVCKKIEKTKNVEEKEPLLSNSETHVSYSEEKEKASSK